MRDSLLTICSILLFAVGCGEHRCQEAADSHASYTANVLDIYNAGSKFHFTPEGAAYVSSSGSCQGMDGIVPGVSLQFSATGEISDTVDTCLIVTANLTSAPAPVGGGMPSSSSYALHYAQGSTSFMYAVEDVTVGACSGSMIFEFFSRGGPGGILGEPVIGDLPPTLLYRLFLPAGSACAVCDDNFVVQLTKM